MYRFLRPFLFRFDPEQAHDFGFRTASMVQRLNPSLVEPLFEFEHGTLQQRIWGKNFPNPVGLAAGMDKNAELIPFWEAVGFGFIEVGSVSAKPSTGNPQPRSFRLSDDQAIINRMGLNNDGAEVVAERLNALGPNRDRPLGINLAKTHDPDIMGQAALDDFRESYNRLAAHADYVVLNVSCPNTREGKTFEEPKSLDRLLEVIYEEHHPPKDAPLLIKLSPPISEHIAFDSRLDDIIAIARAHGVDGFVATNTASDREGLTTTSDRLKEIGPGGLSGTPLERRATRLVQYLYRATDGHIPIIGVGGVNSAETAYAKIRAGASLVQLYTGLVYEGPGLVKDIKKGLIDLLQRDDFATIQQAIGVDAYYEARRAS